MKNAVVIMPRFLLFCLLCPLIPVYKQRVL